MHPFYLKQALALAQSRRGFCAPNPAVGAIIVKDEQVIATGSHQAAGQPHAEVEAINNLVGSAKGATLYVTLEPCCHQGRTPPCTDLIIKAGLSCVVYSQHDPDPRVAGKGAAQLRKVGVSCLHIDLPEIQAFYASYHHWLQTQRPWVTAKLALSMDAKIAGAEGRPVAITGPECQRLTHQWRLKSDAILTTAQTILTDDPQLNCRLGGAPVKKRVFVIDRCLQLSGKERIFTTAAQVVLLHAERLSPPSKLSAIPIPEIDDCLDLNVVIDVIGREGVHDLWVEAGGKCLQGLLAGKHIQRCLLYLSPQLLGTKGTAAFQVQDNLLSGAKNIDWQQYGQEGVCTLEW